MWVSHTGKSLLVTFGLFSKVTRCKSGTNSCRYRSNGYVLGLKTNNLLGCQSAIGGKPPSHRYQAISATTAASALAGSTAWLIGRPITR